MNRELDPERHESAREQARQDPERRSLEFESRREHRVLQDGGYTYHLSPAELDAVRDVGRFRTIAIADLNRYRYQGQRALMQQDLRSLRAQGLVQLRTVWNGPKSKRLAVAVLTKLGKRVLEAHGQMKPGQASYSGFVKPAEVRHDAAIYRMYQSEKQKIERAGGQIRRVVLDFELKRKVYSPLAKAKSLHPDDYAKRQAEVARENGLTVIQGKIPLPDLRIEYVAAGGELARVDLELTTAHYHGPALQTKAEAGFKMYAASDSVSRLSRALEERDIVATILSL